MISEIVHIDFLDHPDFVDFLISVSKENESVLGYHFPFYLQMLQNTGIGEFYGVILKEDKTEQIFGCDEKKFKLVVKTAFNQRRKMLRGSIKSLLQPGADITLPVFSQRPEQLSVQEFKDLTNLIFPQST